jgi:hypothetical protein
MHVIPVPVYCEELQNGSKFVWPERATISGEPHLCEYLQRELRRRCSLTCDIVEHQRATVRLVVVANVSKLPELNELCRHGGTRHEAYTLRAESGHVEISAEACAGIFYGCQTLLQLFDWIQKPLKEYPTLPACYIADAPRFQWYAAAVDKDNERHAYNALNKITHIRFATSSLCSDGR